MEKQKSLLKNTKKQERIHWDVFIDGASRNNPGPAGAGIFIKQKHNILVEEGFFLGDKTNNQAEYLALLLALFIVDKIVTLEQIKYPHLVIHSDSELLVRQITGSYKSKNRTLASIKKIIELFLQNKPYTIKHIVREKNTIADALANQGIDTQKEPPLTFLNLLISHEIDI